MEDWISQETLGDGKSGACPGNITSSMGTPSGQYNGQLRPLMNTTIKGAIWCTRVGCRILLILTSYHAAALASPLKLSDCCECVLCCLA